ncbi:MAG: methyltransferase domain-containing protein [Candidatus Aegiribacteria sp.]|nr:methyltransferase domain-containing protein [Candidatus Aegiribacteria sp.]
MTEKEKRDWSEKDLRKVIVDQRRFLWRDDMIDRISSSLNLKHGMTAVDVGCGLGYLGWTFWRHFGEGGTYMGVDCSEKLLTDAREMSEEWSNGGNACFLKGKAFDIPLQDSFSDLTMCQTLLMHLKKPEAALAEMIRVTKPGGGVMCMEPDNLSSSLAVPFSSRPSIDLNERMFWFKASIIWAEGRKRLGKGDWGIGSKVPKMMADAGLVRIDCRCNDIPGFIQPPYETEAQRYSMDKMREHLNERDEEEKKEEEEKRSWKEYKECFIAGGGSLSTYYRIRKLVEEKRETNKEIILDQVKSGSYYAGPHPSGFFCFTGFVQDIIENK